MALRNGKPIAGAVFTAIDSDLSEQTIKAGADGIAGLDAARRGPILDLHSRDAHAAGTLQGDQKYDEIREFATLALEWPLETLSRRSRGGRSVQGRDRAPRPVARLPRILRPDRAVRSTAGRSPAR